MFNFGLSQKLWSLFFLSIGVSVLLALSLPAAAVNSPTLTVLDMEEMSQIAGGSTHCFDIGRTSNSRVGNCRASNSFCLWLSACGTNPYVVTYGQEYCKLGVSPGHHNCTCYVQGHGWQMWNCQVCLGNRCKRDYLGSGGERIECMLSSRCK